MRTALCCLASAALACGATLALSAPRAGGPRSAEEILRSYVEDFRSDPAAAEERTFGVRVEGEGGGEWTVEIPGERAPDGTWDVDLVRGMPGEPTFHYRLGLPTLEAIDAGRMNALTAQGKAFASDAAPMEAEFAPEAAPHDVNAFSFHFWTRGFPERIPFRRELTRNIHGVDNVPLYYQPGLRTIWSSISKGQRVDNGPGQPIVVPFPAMIVAVKGCAKGTVAGEPVEACAGEAIFIPPMTPYEWWNEGEEPVEAILLFFGEGA